MVKCLAPPQQVKDGSDWPTSWSLVGWGHYRPDGLQRDVVGRRAIRTASRSVAGGGRSIGSGGGWAAATLPDPPGGNEVEDPAAQSHDGSGWVKDEAQGGEEDGLSPALGLHGRHHKEEGHGGRVDQVPQPQPPRPILLHGAALQPVPQSLLQPGFPPLFLLYPQQLVLYPGHPGLNVGQAAVDRVK